MVEVGQNTCIKKRPISIEHKTIYKLQEINNQAPENNRVNVVVTLRKPTWKNYFRRFYLTLPTFMVQQFGQIYWDLISCDKSTACEYKNFVISHKKWISTVRTAFLKGAGFFPVKTKYLFPEKDKMLRRFTQ